MFHLFHYSIRRGILLFIIMMIMIVRRKGQRIEE